MAIGQVTKPESQYVPDESQVIPHGFLTESISEFRETLRELARINGSKSRIIDVYRTQSLSADSEVTIELQPEFERIPERIEHIIITGPTQGTPGISLEGQSTAPAANSIITQYTAAAAPPGNYTLNWKVDLDGTPGAGDVNNVKVTFPNSIATAAMDGAVGSYIQEPLQVTIPQGNATALAFKAIGAGTAGAIYTVAADLIPNGGFPVTLQLGDRVWNLLIPGTGILEISPKSLLLQPQHRRILTASFAGDYSLELLGYADVRNRT